MPRKGIVKERNPKEKDVEDTTSVREEEDQSANEKESIQSNKSNESDTNQENFKLMFSYLENIEAKMEGINVRFEEVNQRIDQVGIKGREDLILIESRIDARLNEAENLTVTFSQSKNSKKIVCTSYVQGGRKVKKIRRRNKEKQSVGKCFTL